MPVLNYRQYLVDEIKRRHEAALRGAKSLVEDLGYVVVRLERTGADGGGASGTGFVNGAVELKDQLTRLNDLVQGLREFDAFESLRLAEVVPAAGDATSEAAPPASPVPVPAFVGGKPARTRAKKTVPPTGRT